VRAAPSAHREQKRERREDEEVVGERFGILGVGRKKVELVKRVLY
jgi:hypothetical protein